MLMYIRYFVRCTKLPIGGAQRTPFLTFIKKYDIIYIEEKRKKGVMIMNDIVGKYKGIKVYKVTFPEYVNNRLYKNKDNIYLIDGELIYNNEAFASYNGNYVSDYDPHKKRTFYTVPTFTVNGGIGKEGYDTANGKLEPKISSTSGNETKTETISPKSVEETLAGVFDSSAIEGAYETDYFSGMTDVDAFLKANLEF